jgi:hypothetical protein
MANGKDQIANGCPLILPFDICPLPFEILCGLRRVRGSSGQPGGSAEFVLVELCGCFSLKKTAEFLRDETLRYQDAIPDSTVELQIGMIQSKPVSFGLIEGAFLRGSPRRDVGTNTPGLGIRQQDLAPRRVPTLGSGGAAHSSG